MGKCELFGVRTTVEVVYMYLNSSLLKSYSTLCAKQGIELKNNQTHEQSIVDCIRTHIKEKLDYYIVGNDIDNAFFNNWVKFDWIIKVTTKEVILHQKKFNNFVKCNDCLNDGGISSQKIGEKLFEETNIKPVKKVRTINGETMGTITYSYRDFAKMMRFTVQEEEMKE